MDLDQYISGKTALIDSRLDAEMPGEHVPPRVLHSAMRYAVFPAGKRLRPVVCLAAAEAAGAGCEVAFLPAVALELFHSYTLVHDDLPCMDDDDTRRGRPSCHVKFGEANAVLAGDALQALAFEILARHNPPECAARMVKELAQSAGSLGVAGGQVEDLVFTESTPTAEMIDYIHLHKTADLFRAAVCMGAMAGQADEQQLSDIRRYGTSLGLLFQLTDDLLDAPKPGSVSSAEGASYLLVHDLETARKRITALAQEAVSALQRFNGPGRDILEAMVRFVAERKH